MLEFWSAIFEANAYQVAEGAILRRKFIVAAHLTISKYAHMVLVFKIQRLSKAHKLVGILPRDEVIPESLRNEI